MKGQKTVENLHLVWTWPNFACTNNLFSSRWVYYLIAPMCVARRKSLTP